MDSSEKSTPHHCCCLHVCEASLSGLDCFDWHSRVQVCTPSSTSVCLSLFVYHKPALASSMFCVCHRQFISLWSKLTRLASTMVARCPLRPHMMKPSPGDYSTLKGDLAESWLQGYYVTLSLHPRGQRAHLCLDWPSAHPHSKPIFTLQHTDILKTPPKNCISAMRKTWESWRQEITPRCANKWLILDWLRNIMYNVLTSYFLPGQTGAWENHTPRMRVKRSKAGIASLLTPPQNQCEAGREKHTTCRQND